MAIGGKEKRKEIADFQGISRSAARERREKIKREHNGEGEMRCIVSENMGKG